MKLMWIENSDRQSNFLGDNPNWFCKVRIVRDEYSYFKAPLIGVP